ncbi:MAG: folate-binding protein YgfZ [Legionella sp.]|nr:MAG: folate-binding protein YgfZ [Legionella sp.]
MKPILTHILNERAYTAFHPLAQELTFEEGKPFVFDLSYLSVLDVLGDAASSYLQGQLSCHLDEVTTEQMRPGAQCNLQGRIMALLDVVMWEGLHLVLSKDILPFTQMSLGKSALFSRVTLKENTDLQVLGLYVPKGLDFSDVGCVIPKEPYAVTHTQDYCGYALSDTLCLLLCKPAYKEAFLAQFPLQQQRGSLAWHALELEIPRLSIYPNTRGLFLPHRLDLQHTPYISFNKGCYKGQEIIARTHYRAKLKHHLKSFMLTVKDPLFAGQKMYADLKQSEIGEVIDVCPLGADTYRVLVSILLDHPSNVYFEHMSDHVALV